MPTQKKPNATSPKALSAFRAMAYFMFGTTLLVMTGCAKMGSPVYGEKEFDPTASGPSYTEADKSAPETQDEKSKESEKPTEDELFARANKDCEGCIFPRTARNADGSVYTKHGEECIEGFYFYDNDGKLWVSYFKDRVPLSEKETAIRRGQPVRIQNATKTSAMLRDSWEKQDAYIEDMRQKIGASGIKKNVAGKVQAKTDEIKTGESILKGLGRLLPSRVEVKPLENSGTISTP